MNVYDFDNTIYEGDSTVDFLRYNLKVQPSLWRCVPGAVWSFLLYRLGRRTKTEFKGTVFLALKDVPDLQKRIADFWALHFSNIKPWYPKIRLEDDVVVSASPDFLVRPACERLGIRYVIASPVDPGTCRYTGENCWGPEKVRRFREEFPDAHVENAFSDSLSDAPICALAEQAYLVLGSEFLPWPGR